MFHPNPFDLEAADLEAIIVDFNDTIPGDTLFINRSEEGYPLSCFRKITAGVCIDNECRILRINLYWTMTGRYLGFELPVGEFLSKTEHVEFNDKEYKKMHTLLSDPYSLLVNFSMDELAPEKNVETDAVSSATISDVLAFTVEGAVYTTYTMWHLVYGDTRRKIIKMTEQELTIGLLEIILKSSDVEDRVWGLNHIWGYVKPTDKLYDLIFENIQNDNIYLAEKAIEVIPPEASSAASIQLRLLNCFNSANNELKRLILNKLQDASTLHGKTIENLASGIYEYNDPVITDILALFAKHSVSEPNALQNMAGLLQHENRFIARKAYLYLEGIDIQNSKIKQQMNLYQSVHK
ncbi:MAG: hypothetical protein AMS26_19560 [Bacteroides sp. SM23_62]|nr:MAG: hypothetical protein AMS26_19560 [Bacteroides sp. SM23_62]